MDGLQSMNCIEVGPIFPLLSAYNNDAQSLDLECIFIELLYFLNLLLNQIY